MRPSRWNVTPVVRWRRVRRVGLVLTLLVGLLCLSHRARAQTMVSCLRDIVAS
jgi:hypothetical protein